ncbi:ImmA/IrrE family metallo-endopeptidase [Helcococcus ovis]|uniref:ImmA/IrrE family metallo-endopeptidase n=1 Tax=Helcococcus ovis TaxID=72026 RepID=UPI00106FCD82|nr:ImmA/IrrE family metallo-endopeptidase [Helcococcus ovis]TFF65027.1 ImmA/IrrE family metallo-endopeptidase [Helcococcus ovis]
MNTWIYNKANRLVKKYGTRNPEILIKELNIKLYYMGATSRLLGMYRIILKNRFIFIPNNLGTLTKTVLAHELGHDQLHRKECEKGASFHESSVFNFTSKYELEANIFAAHLLISDEDIYSMFKYRENEYNVASELGVDINLLNLKISEMAKMGLLNINELYCHRPDSTFLKNYRPLDDEWSNA